MSFTYPVLTQRPLVGQVTGEKVQIPSRKITVGRETAEVLTWAGGEDVSIQVIQRSDPSYLALSGELYAEAMALATEQDAYATISAAVTATTTLPAAVGGDAGWLPALVGLAGDMLTGSRLFPDTLVCGTDVWVAAAGAVGTDGRPLFAARNAQNALGSASLVSTSLDLAGLTLTVSPILPADEAVYGNRRAFTTALGGVQTMSADVPALLGRDYAIYQFGAMFVRRPAALRRLKLAA
jgi:hypothetical protein